MKLSLLLLSCATLSASELPPEFVRAIHLTETSGRLGAILGDYDAKVKTYKALGPLQIHKACWIDSKIPGNYQQCTNLAYSTRVMAAYLTRYCPLRVARNDFEAMARVWNGGPNGMHKNASLKYWLKVKSNLK